MTHPTITRAFLQSLRFKVMPERERQGFAGCSSPVPLIAEYGDKYIVVIDGDYCEIVDAETITQVDICQSITNLSVTEEA